MSLHDFPLQNSRTGEWAMFCFFSYRGEVSPSYRRPLTPQEAAWLRENWGAYLVQHQAFVTWFQAGRK